MLFRTDLKCRRLPHHVADVLVKANLVFQVKFLRCQPILEFLQFSVRECILHGQRNLFCDLYEKLDVVGSPGIIRHSTQVQGADRAIPRGQRNEASGLDSQFHIPRKTRIGKAVDIGIANHNGLPGRQHLGRGHSFRLNRSLQQMQELRARAVQREHVQTSGLSAERQQRVIVPNDVRDLFGYCGE